MCKIDSEKLWKLYVYQVLRDLHSELILYYRSDMYSLGGPLLIYEQRVKIEIILLQWHQHQSRNQYVKHLIFL